MSEEVKGTEFELSEEFISDIQKDSKINDLDLRGECRSIVNRTQRYVEEYYRAKRKLMKMQAYVKKVEGELFHKYKNEFEIKLTSSTDIMKYVNKDKKYQNAIRICNDLECLVDFLDRTIKNMNNNAWLVQKLVDLEKINQ
jgi:hypothetical protein